MTEIKTTNRGGKRAGAGRKHGSVQKAPVASSKPDVIAAPITVKDDEGQKVKLNVVEEIAKIYLELTNKSLAKEERAELKDRVSILKELLPFTTAKKPIESLNTSNDKPTTINIKGIDLEKL